MRIRGRYIVVGGIDWARSSGKTGRLLVGASPEGRLVVFSELLLHGGAQQRAAGAWAEMDREAGAADELGRSLVEWNVMGRDAFSEESGGMDVASQLAAKMPIIACPARLEDAIDRMNELLMAPPVREPEPDEPEDAQWPKLVIVEGTCPNLVGQLRTLTRQQLESKSQGTKDLVDALRMVVMTQVRARFSAPMRQHPERSFERFAEGDARYTALGEPI